MRLGGAKGKDSRHSGAGVGGRGGTGLETGVEGMGKGVQVSGLGYDDLGKDWQHSLVLATGSADGNIYVFDLSKGQVIRGAQNERERILPYPPVKLFSFTVLLVQRS